MAIHPNSLKNLRTGRPKGSKNKIKLEKKDVEELVEKTEDIKTKSEESGLSKDDLVEVLIKSKKSSEVVKSKKPTKSKQTISEDLTLLTNDQHNVDYEPTSRKVTLKEFFFGMD
jgi:hypothetical protein